MKKVLISDSISPKGVEILKSAGLEVDVQTGLPPEELKKIIGAYHGLVIRSATKVTADIISAAENLKVIGRAGSGLDNVDKAAATQKGIVVMNTPGGNTITTAEHAMALLFSVARLIPQATGSMRSGLWEKKKFMGVELFGKTLGIVGMGNIGAQVAKKALGLDMNVLCYDPFLNEEKAKSLGVHCVGLEELWKRADFITLHTPLTPETKYLVNAKSIAMMKDGVRIINCARGGIVNEKDLLDALNSGKVAGAALDVFEKEPPTDNPLCTMEKVVCTPHLGASTKEAQENVALAVAEQVADYLVGGIIRNAVNFPSIPPEQVPLLSPYLKLAERMGGFASQVFESGIKEISIEYTGEASGLNTAPVTIAAVKGLLSPIMGETVNFVNALVIAKERGIEIKETKSSDAGDYRSMISLRIKGEKESSSISGTIFSKKDPRIIEVDGAPVEIIPEGTMLFMYNNDRPGLIGAVGTFLGSHGINIARMFFGRESEGGTARSVVSIDSPLQPELIEELKKIPNILSVRQVVL
ncbi:MAG: phosphoglycerate dehydrogenase [Nitrospiraceae bacterium]|nr:phosphoglycerate dehydrogenase [Nitrospiraceae bacterium]